MKKSNLIALVLAIANSMFAINLAVSPSSMEWTDQGFVGIDLSSLAVGAKVELSAFVDIDGDGVLDSTDPLAVRFELQDGVANSFGATTFVDDNDGTANGAIDSAISFYGNNYLKSIGSYIWMAVELNGSGIPIATNTTIFSITQPASTIWITGEVRDYVTSNTVAGAYVELQYYSDTTGTPPSTWSDGNGEFSIQLPAGVPANEVMGVYAAALGKMSVSQNPDTGDFISMGVFTNGLATGANPLPQPLFSVPPVPMYGLVDITGTLYLVDGGQTNPLAGGLVEMEYPDFDDENDGSEVNSIDISAEDGSFSLVFPADEGNTVTLSCANAYLTMRGLTSTPLNNLPLEGATNGIALFCHKAEALVSGTVTNKVSGNPIVGLMVELTSGNDPIGMAHTISNGLYEVGLQEGEYNARADDDSLTQQHYVYANEGGYRYIGNLYSGEVRSGQDLAYAQGVLLSGHVYTEGGNPLGGGDAILVEPSEDDWEYRIMNSVAAFDGHYTLLAAPGTWNVRTENTQGAWIDLYYTNTPIHNLALATPIVVSNAPVGGIDFYLEEGTRLQGNVLHADGSSAGDIQMNAFQLSGSGELDLIGSGNTDFDNGAFNFVTKSAGTVYLRATSDGWQTPDTWLGNVGSYNLATTFSAVQGSTVDNLNLQILAAYQVSASVKDQFTTNDIPAPMITAYDAASNRYGSAIFQWDSWVLFVPTNIPLTFFAEADGYEGEFITNTYHLADADYFQLPENNFQYLDFVLHSSTRDTDGDGLLDYIEDSHPDGIPEPSDISNPLLADSDNDGADDDQEYYAGTDAWDANSIFKLTEAIPSGSNLTLRWSSIPGREYTVQFSSDLASGSWSNIHTVVATGTETTYSPTTAASTHRYYHVRVEAP